MIGRILKEGLSSVTTPMLLTVCIGLAGLSIAQTAGLYFSERDLRNTRSSLAQVSDKLTFEKQVVANLAARVATSESSRQLERTQASEDYVGLVMQQKAELKNALAAASATASLTGKCPPIAKTQAERKAAWDALHGASQ